MRRPPLALFPPLLLTAALLVGCGGGDSDTTKTSGDANDTDTSSVEPADNLVDVTDPTEDESVVMPDVSGLTEDEARAELGNRGIDDAAITVDPRESLEAPGTVIEQVPSSGQPVTGTVNLIVAAPLAPVPDFAGSQISEVETWASERGIELREEVVPDDTVADGEVIATTPAAGDPATSEILVQVARTPVIQQLSFNEALDESDCGDYDTGEYSIDGEPYTTNYAISYGYECFFEFDLGRDWSRLKAVLGHVDDSSSGSRVRVKILLDGVSKFEKVIDFGATAQDLDIDVTDGLRLRFEISDVSGEGTIGFGDLRLVGAPGAAPEPTESTTE